MLLISYDVGWVVDSLDTERSGSSLTDPLPLLSCSSGEVKMEFDGLWHIYEMELWDEQYFNMEVQAYIELDGEGFGNFQFGMVMGYLQGQFTQAKGAETLEFTWEGGDEEELASGTGWAQLKEADILEGQIAFHGGDRSLFWAKRV